MFTSDASSCTVNLCSGKALALESIIDTMNQLAGFDIQVKVNPEFVRANEVKSLCGNNQLLRELIDFVPQISFTDTLSAMLVN